MSPYLDFLLSCLYDRCLQSEHCEDLRKSGIRDDTIAMQKTARHARRRAARRRAAVHHRRREEKFVGGADWFADGRNLPARSGKAGNATVSTLMATMAACQKAWSRHDSVEPRAGTVPPARAADA